VLYREMGERNSPVKVFTASSDGKKIILRRADAPPDNG
jgi:hypothetical protein